MHSGRVLHGRTGASVRAACFVVPVVARHRHGTIAIGRAAARLLLLRLLQKFIVVVVVAVVVTGQNNSNNSILAYKYKQSSSPLCPLSCVCVCVWICVWGCVCTTRVRTTHGDTGTECTLSVCMLLYKTGSKWLNRTDWNYCNYMNSARAPPSVRRSPSCVMRAL